MKNVRKQSFMIFVLTTFIVAFGGAAYAQHSHGQMHQMSPAKPAAAKAGSIKSVSIGGYKISLEVMDMSAHMSMPGMKETSMSAAEHSKSHAMMVTIQDTASKEIISDAQVKFSLVTPAGAKEAGNLEWSGDHYGASFDGKEKGAYEIQLTVESGGMNREAKFSYKM